MGRPPLQDPNVDKHDLSAARSFRESRPLQPQLGGPSQSIREVKDLFIDGEDSLDPQQQPTSNKPGEDQLTLLGCCPPQRLDPDVLRSHADAYVFEAAGW